MRKGEEFSKDVIYAICYGKNEHELNEYTMMAFKRMSVHKDDGISKLIDEDIMKHFNVLSIGMKRSIIFYMLHIDEWTRKWACDETHSNRIRPPLSVKAQVPFFFGLGRLYKLNLEYKLEDSDFPLSVAKLYDYVTGSVE